MVRDTRRIAELAQAEEITISFEYHSNTLTDTNESARQLLKEVDHPNIRTLWQQPSNLTPDECLDDLTQILPWLSNIHVYHTVKTEAGSRPCPLALGAEVWSRYLARVREHGGERCALIEFVLNETPEQFLEDAEALKAWLAD